MSPAVPILLISGAIAAIYFTTLKKVVNAAQNLRYQLTRVQWYRVDDPLVFRVWIDFANLASTEIIIQKIYLDIFLNFGTVDKPDLQRIATVNPGKSITLAANRTEERAFDVEVRLMSLGVTAFKMFRDKISGGSVNFPTSAIVKGEIQVENFSIPVETECPFDTSQI